MSFSLWITVEHPDGYRSTFEIVDGHTYNLTPMWRRALGIEKSSDLNDVPCSDLREKVFLAIEDIARNRSEYEALNPSNGWGDFDGFREIFWKFAEAVLAHPAGKVGWSG